MIGSVEEFARLCDSGQEEDYLRAIEDQAPTFVWEEIVRKRPDLAEIVASSASVPDSVLEIIALTSPWRARYTVAILPRTPAHVLVKLAKDGDSRVRRAVVGNEGLPLKILGQLRNDDNPEIAAAAQIAWDERAVRRQGRHSAKPDPVWDISESVDQPVPADSEVGRYASYFERLCGERGIPKGAVERAFDPRDPSLPPPPPGPWVVASWDDGYAVGTMRGTEFSIYALVGDLVEAADVVAHLVHDPIGVRRAPADAEERGRKTGAAIAARTRARGGKPGPNELVPGDMLDAFDDDRTHFLFALGTPFAARGQHPAVMQNPYHAYQVLVPMPMAVLEGLVQQPTPTNGGGAIVVLDRPLRWYLDNGFLAEVTW